jgi:hypothetical protein
MARALNAAYADGLLSADTFAARIDQLLKSRIVDPVELVGDLSFRHSARPRFGLLERLADWLTTVRRDAAGQRAVALLGLDWNGAQRELLVGRHRFCDVVLANPSVSRFHARLVFRDAKWIIQDLASTNGTAVNGRNIGRCELHPGDLLALGDEWLEID